MGEDDAYGVVAKEAIHASGDQLGREADQCATRLRWLQIVVIYERQRQRSSHRLQRPCARCGRSVAPQSMQQSAQHLRNLAPGLIGCANPVCVCITDVFTFFTIPRQRTIQIKVYETYLDQLP